MGNIQALKEIPNVCFRERQSELLSQVFVYICNASWSSILLVIWLAPTDCVLFGLHIL